MNLLKMFLSRSRGSLCIATACGLLSGLSTTALILIVNDMIRRNDQHMPGMIGAFVALCVIRLLSGLASHSLLARLSQHAIRDMRMDLCGRIIDAPLPQLEQLGASRLTSAFTQDMLVVASAVVNLPYLLVNVIILAGSFVYLGWLSAQMLLGIGLCFVLGAASYALAIARANRLLRIARQSQEQLFHYFRQLLAGAKELKLNVCRRDAFMNQRVGNAADHVCRHNTAGITLYSATANCNRLLFFVYVGLLLLWSDPHRSSTELASCVILILYMMAPLEAILNAIPIMAQADVSLHKLISVSSLLDREGPADITVQPIAPWRELRLTDICYSYSDDSNTRPFTVGPINLVLRPGQTTFLVGGNGSGKTTLAKIIAGLYQPDSGDVRLDGISRGPIETRAMFAAVFNDFCLFDDLIGIDPRRLHEVDQYLRLLHLDQKVRLANGRFSTTDLSQGQRKRLALLVALLEDRPIYLFDEWAADQEPEFKQTFYNQIVPSLNRRGKAVVVITHDDRYFAIADQLVQLKDGLQLTSSPLRAGPCRPDLEVARNASTDHEVAPTLAEAPLPKQVRTIKRSRGLLLAGFILATALSLSSSNALANDGDRIGSAEIYGGIECLQHAMLLLKQPADMIQLLDSAHSASQHDDATQEIARLALHQNLNALVLPNVTQEQIARCPFPMLIHVKAGRYSIIPDYFVLYSGVRDGKWLIFSPSQGDMSLAPQELDEDRRADAIVISREPLSADLWRAPVPFVKYILMCGTLLTFAALALTRARSRKTKPLAALPTVPASCFQACGIAAIAVSMSLVGRLACGESALAATPISDANAIDFLLPATSTAISKAPSVPPEIDLETALHRLGRALFVDARDISEYNAGHIKGAIVCPANDITHWHLHLAGVDLQQPIIVYCAEASCQKGEYVASFLLASGFTNVNLYRAGWAKWTGPKESQ
jgi:putative ATP-binding cassette transporter